MKYGIDLGTTYSVIAKIGNDGKAEVIPNMLGQGVTFTLPSVVYFPANGDPPVVGAEAKAFRTEESAKGRVAEFTKREIGKPDPKTYEYKGQQMKPIDVAVFILKELARYANATGEDVKDVIITCPASFMDEERRATKQAGEIAGFNVLKIVNEPTAAAINYCINEYQSANTDLNILVYDLGGGTFDVCLLNMKVDAMGRKDVEVIDNRGKDQLGGKDWDEELYRLILKNLCETTNREPDKISEDVQASIRKSVEGTKVSLSNTERKTVRFDVDGERVAVTVTREEFERATKYLVDMTIQYIDDLFKSAAVKGKNITESDVDIVLLVGGSSKMPMIDGAIRPRFPGKVRLSDPDLVVARGAAYIAEQKEQVTVTDIATYTFGLGISTVHPHFLDSLSNYREPEDYNYILENVIFKGDKLPFTYVGDYVTLDNTSSIVARIFEDTCEIRGDKKDGKWLPLHLTPCVDSNGEPQNCADRYNIRFLEILKFEFGGSKPKGYPIKVHFILDTSGLEVVVEDSETGKKKNKFIASQNVLPQETVDEKKVEFARILTTQE
ncbi:MAG: Hsp70 family protein [Syntrophomonadaceae bacterium]|jgi:molecular chaperone DnaK (HSP70)|nr:Hsp70 family protein [Syntrophomonadaceae bacterium]